VQFHTSAENVAIPAFAAARRAAARLLLTAGRAAIDRHLLSGPTAANPQQRSAAAGWDGQIYIVSQKARPQTHGLIPHNHNSVES